MDNLEYAKKILADGGYTCCAYNGEQLYVSKSRGVAPLLEMIDSGNSLEGFCAADRVVGAAAAFLYVILKVERVHSGVISTHALKVFERYGIECCWDELTEAIINRQGTGLCPMESSVMGIEDPYEAETAVRRKLEELRSGEIGHTDSQTSGEGNI